MLVVIIYLLIHCQESFTVILRCKLAAIILLWQVSNVYFVSLLIVTMYRIVKISSVLLKFKMNDSLYMDTIMIKHQL